MGLTSEQIIRDIKIHLLYDDESCKSEFLHILKGMFNDLKIYESDIPSNINVIYYAKSTRQAYIRHDVRLDTIYFNNSSIYSPLRIKYNLDNETIKKVVIWYLTKCLNMFQAPTFSFRGTYNHYNTLPLDYERKC